MPVVFLDIDGVLLPMSQAQRSSPDPFAFPQVCLDALERLLSSSGATLVLSSTWRNWPYQQRNIADQFAARGGPVLQAVASGCVDGQFPLTTEIGVQKPRQHEIAEFLSTTESVGADGEWVALDDEELVLGGINASRAALFQPRAVKVDERVGLTLELADRAVAQLSACRSFNQAEAGKAEAGKVEP
jgi:hypothetical protein